MSKSTPILIDDGLLTVDSEKTFNQYRKFPEEFADQLLNGFEMK